MPTLSLHPANVFPTTKMNSVNKLITEGNLTRLINTLLDENSYLVPISGDTFNLYETIWDAKLQGLLKVQETDVDSELEVVLKGYYFNLGTIRAILEALNTPDIGTYSSCVVVGQILIDETDSSYPELYGEESETDSVVIDLDTPFVPGQTEMPELDPLYRNLSIKTISATATQEGVTTTYTFVLDSNWKLTPTSEASQGISFSSYTIDFVSYYSLIKLHVLKDDDAMIPYGALDINDTYDSTLGTNYKEFSLPILCVVDNDVYLPITSFPKFHTTSIYNIDGGELL